MMELWVISVVIVLIFAIAAFKYLRMAVLFFALAFGGMMLLHYQQNPTEAGTALATLGAGLLATRPIRGLLRWFV